MIKYEVNTKEYQHSLGFKLLPLFGKFCLLLQYDRNKKARKNVWLWKDQHGGELVAVELGTDRKPQGS